jgi:TonB-dependent SusC/RagA subfamily outer membrane receptor
LIRNLCISATIPKDTTTEAIIVLDNYLFKGSLKDLHLDPSQIKSITVLKDAAASSLWGYRAGNGVIVIQTKK